MGTVLSQSIKNTLTNYLGIVVGAINVLFLFTNFLSDDYFGLITFIFSTANIMMPLMAFGTHNTIIKYYSRYKTRQSQSSFLTLMLFLPLAIILPLGLIGYLSFNTIISWLSIKNTIIKDYAWLIYISAVAFAYFEVFYAWSKVQMQSVFGNFMKELFHRIFTTILLICLYLGFLTPHELIYSIVGVYLVRVLIMKLYAFSLRRPVIRFSKFSGFWDVLKYTSLIIIAGSIASIILEIDKFMLGFYVPIEEVAYYGVAIYMASVIGVPARAMQQITSPLTAELLNDKNMVELKTLYKRSSLTLFIIGGFIFLLIILNINELYVLLPEKYGTGLFIVILIGVSELLNNLLGNNNDILFNSNYYRMVLFLGVLLVIMTAVLNMIFIPLYGGNGAALATFIVIFLYNISKLLFVSYAFKMIPFTINTLKTLLLILSSVVLFYFWDFPFYPLINIALKTLLLVVLYSYIIYKYQFSEDISAVIDRILNLFFKIR
ncbi:sugar isomerase [Pseudalgibacter alginicilyticus]|uniref:Sugar isomerase n=1 Tax=Pseudalgibacter alginicilyticus TaxID=1736674 RepID=A0A0P0DC98_9FLAO|nr:oligosaccharide flippase family protein [Pseudalgibacter alginicilyticus]ALJ06584.1 sugar isomerase [Pseudalgibacter alginicilyticus]